MGTLNLYNLDTGLQEGLRNALRPAMMDLETNAVVSVSGQVPNIQVNFQNVPEDMHEMIMEIVQGELGQFIDSELGF